MGKNPKRQPVNERLQRKNCDGIIEVELLLLNYLEDKARLFMLMNAASKRGSCGAVEALSLCPACCRDSASLKIDEVLKDADAPARGQIARLANRVTTAEILMRALNSRERFVIDKFYIQDYKMQDVEHQYAEIMPVPLSGGALRALKHKALVKLENLLGGIGQV